MTSPAFVPLHDRLPAIEPARASLQSRLVEHLNRRRLEGLTLSAEIADADRVEAWIALDAAGVTLHVAPLIADKAVAPITDPAGRPDVALAAAALGTVEPVIAAIELAVGRPLRPTEVVDKVPDDSVIVQVDARDHSHVVHRLLLAVEAGATLAAADALPADLDAFADIAPTWTVRIAAPALPSVSLARIGAGDLLLLGTAPGLARFTPPGRDTVLAGRLDVEGGLMVLEHDLGPERDPIADSRDPVRTAGGDPAAIHVPLVVEIDGGGLSLERLAALGVGSVVAIDGAAGGTLPARLVAGGRPVATGELVAVGEGYGLLVTATVADRAAKD